MEPFIYPASPAGVSAEITMPSATFKANVQKVVFNIIVFMLLYLILLMLGALLALAFGYVGLFIIIRAPTFLTILAGAGLIGIGAMVLYFLVKFLFANTKADASETIEVTEEDYPELFAFIRKVSEEAGAQFPKHIYLVQGVNAYVSYDSNLRSLFFNVPKNLTIGLGLVNMINLSEFKAILAHEFGHFSQDSMRAGVYVYQANRVIYNMMYDNDSFSKVLNNWAGMHAAFALCARITVTIVTGIQWLLRTFYTVLNRSYMGLSRQMEFHADAVSAKVGGSNNCIHGLRRSELADVCYNDVIAHYNTMLAEDYKGTNMYAHQLIDAGFVAKMYELDTAETGIPVLHNGEQFFSSFRRVNIENQWASHPTREQREEALQAIGTVGEVCEVPTWTLFRNGPMIQEKLTEQLYKPVQFKEAARPLNDDRFFAFVEKEQARYSYPQDYNGYYNGRNIVPFDMTTSGASDIKDAVDFFEKNKNPMTQINGLKQDIGLLTHVADKKNGIRYFDCDGTKYRYKAANDVKQTLEKELKEKETALAKGDVALYHYYHNKARANGSERELQRAYEEYFEFYKLTVTNLEYAERIYKQLGGFYQGSISLERARVLASDLEAMTTKMQEKIQVMVKSYQLPLALRGVLSINYKYLGNGKLNSDELQKTGEYIQAFGNWNMELRVSQQKALLERQLMYGRETMN